MRDRPGSAGGARSEKGGAVLVVSYLASALTSADGYMVDSRTLESGEVLVANPTPVLTRGDRSGFYGNGGRGPRTSPRQRRVEIGGA